MQLVADEAVRQRQLDTMKRRATALLVFATVVFVAARYLEVRTLSFWWGALRATAEAAMVGGLADWFAVTALFRHPLGIPIPHTAIVPRRKDRVGRTLGAFVQRNFLARDVIEKRLRGLAVGERLARWLATPENARRISRHAAGALSSAAHLVPDDQVESMIGDTVAERVRAVRVAPLLGKLLEVLTEGNRHQQVLSEMLHVATRAVDENRTLIRERIEKESPWWLPDVVDEKIYRKVLGAIERTMAEIETDQNHPIRERFDAAIKGFIDRLESSPEMAQRIETWKEELLVTESIRRFSASVWLDGKEALARHAAGVEPPAQVADAGAGAEQAGDTAGTAEGRGGLGGAAEGAIVTFGERLLEDPELLARMEDTIIEMSAGLVARYQEEVADLIAHTVASWDPYVTSKRIELAIGRDLQFIRINGTLVGGLAGLTLYFISHLL